MATPELRELAARLQAICLASGIRVAAAESCTGGRVADALTDVPGSSGYFAGGVVAYEDAAKTAMLGVAPALLAAHGAVSAQAAVAMAEGARALFHADLAVAVTGIAGPGGATAGKPAGLTYVAASDGSGTDVGRHVWPGDRDGNKAASARAALELLLVRARHLQRARAGDAVARSAEGMVDGPR